jgi:exosortase A
MSAVLSPPAATTPPWRQALPALGLLLAAVLLLYRESFAGMVGIWERSDTFAHAFLVPPMAVWLIWRKRAALAPYMPAPQPWLLLPMALLSFCWLVGDLAGSNAVTQLCATALLVLAVPAVLGLAVARQLLFPLAFLFFMVPIGEFLLPLMMEATADFTVAAVSLSGVPVYREGLNFVIPSGSWSVVEACSGVRYLIASFMVGTLFAYLNYSTLWRRLVFVGVSILVPVLANWLRAYLIVMLGHLSGNKLAVGVDHLIYGWLFFGVVIMLMFLVGARWSEPEAVPATPAPRALGQTAASALQVWMAASLAAVVLALAPFTGDRLAHGSAAALPRLAPPALAGTQDASTANPLPVPVFPGAAAQASRLYAAPGGEVMLHLAYFRHQGYGAKVASSSNLLMRDEDTGWSRASTNRVATLQSGAGPVTLRVAELVGGGLAERRRVEVRQVYWVGGRYTSSDAWATVLSLWGRMSGQGDDAAVLTMYAEGDSHTTGPLMDQFVGSHLGALSAYLSGVRAQR